MSMDVTRLPSGLVVVTDAMPHLESASLGVWVGAGSRDEQADEHGISHFLEHMAFKGTAKRTARQIAEEIEAVGGDLNAATSVETTAYYARVLRADVPLALDTLSDILANPTFEPEELAREKNVIVQEIGATEDTPDDLIFEYLQGVTFPDQPVGRTILGTPETVRSFDSRKLRSYLARNYRAPDMVVAAAGAVDHRQVVAEVEQRFAAFTGPEAPLPEPATFSGGARIEQRDLEQVHVAFALEGVPQRDPSMYSLQVFTNVLGGGMSSRLFQEVREIRGLCRHRCVRSAGADARGCRRDRQRGRDADRSRDRPLQGADESRPADGAGKLRRARRATRAPDDDLWPSDPARRDRRPDRVGDGGKRAGGGCRPDRTQPSGDRGAGTGTWA
jgi:predicted Zn-dependent peptidase